MPARLSASISGKDSVAARRTTLLPERASATSYKRILAVIGLDASTSHRVRIVAVGNGRVDVDALLTLR